MYKVVQTAPNTQPGGMKDGLRKATNQPLEKPELLSHPLSRPRPRTTGTVTIA
jgi:hypothetical protein